MKKTKFFAAILSVSVPFSLIGCSTENKNSDSKDLDSSVREEVRSIAMQDELLTGELENKTIKWLANWDINPDDTGKNVPIDLAVFQERYGGNIEYHQTTYEDRYEKLAECLNSGEGIDFFYAGDLDAVPKGAVKDMFVPVDDYIDFSSPLWKDVQQVNDSAIWKDKHYMAIVQVTGDNCGVIYNRKTVREAGLDDPAELLAKDEWTWDAFQGMLEDFVDPANQRYGIDGWFFEFGLMGTTGVPAIALENGELVNKLSDPSMERAQNLMYDLYNNGSIAIASEEFNWNDKPAYIGEGKTLFYPCGLYAFYKTPDQWKSDYGEDAFFVPMPRDPEADEYYIPVGLEAYVMVKGGQNPEGVAKYLDCKRYTLLNEQVNEISERQMTNDYGWSSEMVDMRNTMQELAEANPVIEFSKGVSVDCGKLLDESLRYSSRGKPWNETYDSIASVVDQYIKEINDDED